MSVDEMAAAHWEYVRGLVELHDVLTERYIEIIGHHYKTAFIHGYKHGAEDAQPCK